MKNLIALFAAIVLVTGLTSTVKAQVSATASGTATIITPIAIVKTLDMNFGSIASSVTAGTVILPPTGARTITGGVTLPAVTGTVTSAAFTVSGLASSTYAITLPATALTLTSGVNTMSVGTFTSNPLAGAGQLSSGGSQTVNVGATLTVGASQVAGTYVSGTPFTVTVNYN
jgi:hypothetical protein